MNNLQSCQRRHDAQTDERERYNACMVEYWLYRQTFYIDKMVDDYLFGPVCQGCDMKLAETEETKANEK